MQDYNVNNNNPSEAQNIASYYAVEDKEANFTGECIHSLTIDKDYQLWQPYLKLKQTEVYPCHFSYSRFFHEEVHKLISKVPNCKHNIFRAINEKLIQVNYLNTFLVPVLQVLLSDNGLIALREKFITPKQVKWIHFPILDLILSDNGLVALRENLMTLGHMQMIDLENLRQLLTHAGIDALRKNPMTDDQANRLCSVYCAM